jgi:Kef-type K+ transport system membrane component KefB
MDFADYAAGAVHVVAALAGVLLAAHLGRLLTRALRQPGVIVEVAIGLLSGPVIMAIGGNGALTALMPPIVSNALRVVGEVGLVLFLVSVAHNLRAVRIPSGRTLTRIVSGALLLPIVGGVAFAAWVLLAGDPSLRSSKPAVALVLLLAAALSVTAVPVLARLLADVGLVDSEVAKLAMVTAVVTDVVAWVLLALAVGLTAGTWNSLLVFIAATVITVISVLLALRLLRTEPVGRFLGRFPRSTATLIAAVALVAAVLTKRTGLTEVCGALAVGFALPAKPQWEKVVGTVSRLGRQLIPVYFVGTGITVLTSGMRSFPVGAIVMLTVLATAGKVAGSYCGARAAGKSPELSLRLGVLLNTRGLTELVVLQAGYSAGILTAPLFAVFVVMALLTTAMTGPAYALIDRYTARRRAEAPTEHHPAPM